MEANFTNPTLNDVNQGSVWRESFKDLCELFNKSEKNKKLKNILKQRIKKEKMEQKQALKIKPCISTCDENKILKHNAFLKLGRWTFEFNNNEVFFFKNSF